MTVADVLGGILHQGVESPDAIAIVQGGRPPLTYGQLAWRIRTIAGNLVDEGLRFGDRVLFAVRPGIDAIVLILSILYAGGAIVGADLAMGDEVFAARMALARPTWVVAESRILALSAWPMVRALLRNWGLLLPELVSLPECRFVRVGPRWPGVPRSIALQDFLRRQPISRGHSDARADPSSAAFVVFTSGTTDAPKAVVHTRASLGATVELLAERLALDARDVLLSPDLHAIVPALLAGARVVIPNRAFSPRRFVQDLQVQHVTHAFGNPEEFQRVIDYLGPTVRRLPSCLRVILLGAAPVYASFLVRLRQIVPPDAAVWCVYAMTEMLPVARVSMEDKLSYNGPGDLVGAPVAGVCAQLAKDGELLLRGRHMFWGYLGDPEPAAEVRTGDIATFDASGRIVLLGRKKDMIIRRGHNIYPGLVEPIVDRIAGVRQSALVGVYDERLAGERVVLAVEAEEGQDTARLQHRLSSEISVGKHAIDAAARPDAIVMTAIPVVGRSYKIDRAALRQRLRELLPPC